MRITVNRPIWWSAAAVGVLGYVTLWPTEYRIPCLFHAATGLLCPGCGTTRSLTALVQGDFQSAFSYNSLIFFIPVFLASYQLSKRSRYSSQINIALAVVGALGTLGFFLVRNNFV